MCYLLEFIMPMFSVLLEDRCFLFDLHLKKLKNPPFLFLSFFFYTLYSFSPNVKSILILTSSPIAYPFSSMLS